MLLIESYYVCFKGTIDEYPEENIIYSVKNEYLSKELKKNTWDKERIDRIEKIPQYLEE